MDFNLHSLNKHLFTWVLVFLSWSSYAQLEDCEMVLPPFEFNGIEVTDMYDTNVCFYPNWPDTLYYCHDDSTLYLISVAFYALGYDTNWVGGDAPFNYQLFFSKPVKSIKISLVLGGGGNFIFSAENTGIQINSNYMCSAQIIEDTVFLGDTLWQGSGVFSILFDCPINSFSIRGNGGGGGSGFQICKNSLTTPYLWGKISGDSILTATQDSIFFTAFGGVAPYEFSYTVNGGLVQTLVSNTPQAWLPAPASNGAYTYELLQVKDGNDSIAVIGCNSAYVAVVSLASTAELEVETVNFSLSPNPAKEELYISESICFKENTAVQITDMEGRTVLETKYQQGEALDISGLKSGLYFLRIESEKGWVAKRFVKH